jgi:thymidine kinase
MYSEKSTTAESFYNKYKTIYKNKCIWVKPDIDDRKEGFTKTHNDKMIKAHTISSSRPDLHLAELLEYKVIVIDEAQFFNERLLYLLHKLLKNGCLVIVNGLKLTANRNLFGIMHYLLAEADEIVSLKSVCNVCFSIDYATRTKSFITNSPSVNTGGAEKYYAICPGCDGGSNERKFLQNFIRRQ